MATGGIGALDLRHGSVSYLIPEEQHKTLLDLYYSFPNWKLRQATTDPVHCGRKWIEIYDEMKVRYPDLTATKKQLQSLYINKRKKRKMKQQLASRDKALKESIEEKSKILGLFHENGRKVQALENTLKEKDDLKTKLAASNKENDTLKVELTMDKKEIDDLKTKLMACKKKYKRLLRVLSDEEENGAVDVEV